MKWYWSAALFAFAVLSVAAVWMGGVNQDEGWYLYAANLVAEGKMPYRDFFYTQGPLMPVVYSAFSWIWNEWGLAGGRIFNLLVGAAGIVFAMALASSIAPARYRHEAVLTVFLLLGANLYHLYFLAIPKTYALASLFVGIGFLLLAVRRDGALKMFLLSFAAGLSLSFAAGVRISLVMLLPAGALWVLCDRDWKRLCGFAAGALFGVMLSFGPFLLDPGARAGLLAAQQYHADRGCSGYRELVGSVSRLVRWYFPLFAALVLGCSLRRPDRKTVFVFCGFLAVFLLQTFAPFPYEDYNVPVMGLFAASAAAAFAGSCGSFRWWRLLLVAGLSFAGSFGSPLLEKWSTNGQDRFWPLMKEKYELGQLRDVARRIEALDPGGKTIFTQDTYLAVETGRKVPLQLAMGPFSVLSDVQWRSLIESAPAEYPVAAFSGYAFAIEPPVCSRRPVEQQMEYFELVKKSYRLVDREDDFGQNSTTLLILKRK